MTTSATTAATKGKAKGKGKRRGPAVITDGHKAAMAQGRTESAAVRAYLEAIDTPKRRGRKRSPENVKSRLAALGSEIPECNDPLRRLNMIQERTDLTAELAALESAPTGPTAAVEKAFIASAASYADRKGIGYQAWRDVGVPAGVLRQAGITRSS